MVGETDHRTTRSDRTDSDSNSSSTFKNFVQKYSEEELAILLIAFGAVLLFVPGVNIIGFLLVLIGAATWFTDWLWG